MTQSDSGQKMSLFGLLRHGETIWNSQKRIQGLKNSPLTPRGRLQTRAWLTTLMQWDWQQIYASDLGRVKETVAIINQELQLPVHYDIRLREQNWGTWEGCTLASLKKEHKEELEKCVAMGWDFSAPQGESRASVRDRVFSALSEIAETNPGKNTLIVCHQGIIKTILYHISSRMFMPDEESLIEPNNLHLISNCNDSFTIQTLNIKRAGSN